MLKKLTLILFIATFAIIFTDLSSSFAQTAPQITVTVSKKSFKPGESGVLVIKLKPKAGVKIPKEPPIDVTLTGNGVTGIGLQDYSGAPGGDYFTSPVIKYDFKVNGDAISGTTIVAQVKIKYGYCSSENGVCKIGNTTKTVKIKVK